MYGMPPGWYGKELDRVLTCAECGADWEDAVYFDGNIADTMIDCPFCEDGVAVYYEDLRDKE